MTEFFKYLFLGSVQGATEFLPVSSSGHLTIFSEILRLNLDPDNSKALFALLHLATFFAVLLFTYREIFQIFTGLFKKGDRLRSIRYIILLTIATIPAIMTGLFLEGYIDRAFSSPVFASTMLFITAILLFLSDRFDGKAEILEMGLFGALLVGILQAIAILPGISRSGMTIFGALFIGLSRKDAVKFSFLMSLPVTLGAGILEFSKIDTPAAYGILAFLSAFFMGVIGLTLVKKFVINGKLRGFAFYCIIFAVVSLILLGVV
ncbi:undecaprenyl-diphosphate phosphatase [Kosmotoga pacifica]|uniref:Undecaprenyl-diphosphatase n=1 Tax=Kosmotoga pacifica TaxID=1330330 RepID=A0A0G2ZCP0_9BACT|nr:undecaprenyl-diphosphate phosphatase [Kosmotoga pacifica]AKI97866.1 UDP-diphosphatase [Kosmotoga pacifica]